jgi:anti-sigma regulatory factor (Ser/Thr protein kinase)
MENNNIILQKKFEIYGRDFINGGKVSSEVKDIMKMLNLPSEIIRRVGIASYEAEMNVILYARKGEFNLTISSSAVEIMIEDEGDGIENIELAMQEGYSTASPEIREMGFGAGMGLPNIKKNATVFQIESTPGKGTKLYIRIDFNERKN